MPQKIRGKPRPPGPPVVRVRGGAMQAGTPYRIHYRCDTPGPQIETGTVRGHWTGHTLPQGSIAFAPYEPGRSTLFLFPGEIRSLRRLDREPDGLDTFVAAYVQAALWSSNDESDEKGGQPLDDNHDTGDIDSRTLRRMTEDCRQFLRANLRDIGARVQRAGADFWLTRNGAGAGFWDGDWPEPAASRLTDAAHAFGSFDLYLGDERIHGQ